MTPWNDSGRLIRLQCRSAGFNMSMDDAICQSVAQGTSPPTLRFYSWERPTLSLGYFQGYRDAESWTSSPIDVVRRCTGGGAILHHHDLTYSLSLRLDDQKPGARQTVYLEMHKAIIESLKDMGIATCRFSEQNKPPPYSDNRFLCFQRRTDDDLICGGYKILGSAQRRIRGGLLQHGSLLLSVSPFEPGLPGVRELMTTVPDPDRLTLRIAKHASRRLGLIWKHDALSPHEHALQKTIQADRYDSREWTQRR